MPKTKRKTRTFREKMCNNCQLADEAKLRQGRPPCKYTKKTGKDPDIRNGHCTQLVPRKLKRRKKGDENGSSTKG